MFVKAGLHCATTSSCKCGLSTLESQLAIKEPKAQDWAAALLQKQSYMQLRMCLLHSYLKFSAESSTT
jgi:hypothetical protein